MPVSLVSAVPDDLPVLQNLLQFYIYDFTEMVGGRIGADGKFEVPPLDAYWRDRWRHPFVLRVDGDPAGFALVHHRSRITGNPEIWDMAEFFVLRPYRRKGFGAGAALEIFDRFRGRWEVREVPANGAATLFWRKVIAIHTGGSYSETNYDDERWRGPVQTFENSHVERHAARPGSP